MSEYYLTRDELYHHGILGQKWGVRRFQNADGTYTAEGKARRNSDANSDSKEKLKKIGKTLAVAAVAGAGVYVLAHNPTAVKTFVNKVGPKAVSALSASSKRVGKAMLDAALASVGGIAISKLAEKLPRDESVDESTRYKNQIIYDTVSSGIREAAKPVSSGSGNNKNGGTVGKEISDKLGAPSNKGLDRSSVEYQQLFKDSSGNQRSSDVRSVIKSLASAGYDIDQLKEYVNGVDNGTIKHSYQEIGYYISLLYSDEIIL